MTELVADGGRGMQSMMSSVDFAGRPVLWPLSVLCSGVWSSRLCTIETCSYVQGGLSVTWKKTTLYVGRKFVIEEICDPYIEQCDYYLQNSLVGLYKYIILFYNIMSGIWYDLTVWIGILVLMLQVFLWNDQNCVVYGVINSNAVPV